MTTPAHILTGIAVGSVATQISDIDPVVILVISVLANLLPDFNLLWISEISEHHKDFTHYPVFWIICLSGIAGLEFMMRGDILFSLILIANIFLHLLMDTVGLTIGICWFWPFSNREFSFTKLRKVRYHTLAEYWQLCKNTLALKLEIGWSLLMISIVLIVAIF